MLKSYIDFKGLCKDYVQKIHLSLTFLHYIYVTQNISNLPTLGKLYVCFF